MDVKRLKENFAQLRTSIFLRVLPGPKNGPENFFHIFCYPRLLGLRILFVALSVVNIIFAKKG